MQFNGKEILQDSGKVSAHVAKELAYKEYDKFKIKQDKSLVSDFDKFLQDTKLLEERK